MSGCGCNGTRDTGCSVDMMRLDRGEVGGWWYTGTRDADCSLDMIRVSDWTGVSGCGCNVLEPEIWAVL